MLNHLLPTALHAAEEASREILLVYNSNDFGAELKGDQSPLTIADKKAHQVIEQILKDTKLPILSEEGKSIPFEIRKHWEYFWMVDPLDGTKEFIKRNGEFTVNIALIHKQTPVLGVVVVPVTGEVYYATQGSGAFRRIKDREEALEKRKSVDLSQKGIRVVASRSHMNDETTAFIEKLQAPELISAGSSLKFILLATGQADVYPRFAPTMEWDTAAAHAIILETGMSVHQPDGNSLGYNKENLLNPYFLCR
jgi:3'(2'), 5'-bisphosphate nucleotidase